MKKATQLRNQHIPTNAEELLKLLNRNSSRVTSVADIKMNQKTEDIESRLMELEDYPYIPSEFNRVARLTECLKM